jgi:hypothetical protein
MNEVGRAKEMLKAIDMQLAESALPRDARGKLIITLTTFIETVKRFLDLYREASPAQLLGGLVWYDIEADRVIARAEGRISDYHALAVFAVLSAARNPRHNENLFEHTLADPTNPAISADQREKIATILAASTYAAIADACKGDKINPFFRALAGDVDAVAVDRHIIRIAIPGHKGEGITVNQRRIADAAIRVAAIIAGITPRAMQAVVWVAWRDARVHAMHGLTAPVRPQDRVCATYWVGQYHTLVTSDAYTGMPLTEYHARLADCATRVATLVDDAHDAALWHTVKRHHQDRATSLAA